MKIVEIIFEVLLCLWVIWAAGGIWFLRRKIRDKNEIITDLSWENQTQRDELDTLRADADALAAELRHLNLMFWLLWGGVILFLIWLYRKFSV